MSEHVQNEVLIRKVFPPKWMWPWVLSWLVTSSWFINPGTSLGKQESLYPNLIFSPWEHRLKTARGRHGLALPLHGRVCAWACHGLSKAASPKKSLWRGQCDLKLFNNSLAQWVLLKLWFYRSWDPGPASQASTLLRALAVRTGVSDREGTRQALSRNSPEKGAAVMSCALLLAQHPLLPLRMTQHWPWLLLCRRKSACLRAGWMRT